MNYKFIDLIGIEIEGGWNASRKDLIKDEGIHLDLFSNSEVCGELLSSPLNINNALVFLEKNWPTETIPKAGFHIHVSFKDLSHYCQLMSKNFYPYFIKSMEKWGKDYSCTNENFWIRLSGKNHFCTKKFHPEKQVNVTTKTPQ